MSQVTKDDYHLVTHRYFDKKSNVVISYKFTIYKNNMVFLTDTGNRNRLTRSQARAIVKLLNDGHATLK